jgi:PilZ domain
MYTKDHGSFEVKDERLIGAVHRLLKEARDGAGERRAEKREPFFMPVRISFPADESRQFSCFSKDISPSGIGLLHCMEIEPGEVVLTIGGTMAATKIRCEIIWCQPCGEGWYTSGARFIKLIGPD